MFCGWKASDDDGGSMDGVVGGAGISAGIALNYC